MSQPLAHRLAKSVPVLDEGESVASAARKLLDGHLRALPVANARGRFAGVFGEREFLRALFPGYLGELKSAAFLTAELDEAIERRAGAGREPVREFMTTDHVDVPAAASDMQIAEVFMHHRVLILPVIDNGAVVGVIDRQAFFEEMAGKFLSRLAPD
jgi:CBS domain-containing protein